MTTSIERTFDNFNTNFHIQLDSDVKSLSKNQIDVVIYHITTRNLKLAIQKSHAPETIAFSLSGERMPYCEWPEIQNKLREIINKNSFTQLTGTFNLKFTFNS